MAARSDGATIQTVSTTRAASLRHVRPVQPLRFPEQEPEAERMGQGSRHRKLCNALYEMLCEVCAPEHTVGADAFVYFDASNPRRCLAPDAFVTLGVRDHDFEGYLVWEEGTPDVAFEVLSPSDTPERWTFKEKLQRYRALGVRELVVFDVDAAPGERLRVWDRLEHDLVERVVTGDATPCVTLGVTLLVEPVEGYAVGLRLARDPEGRVLTPSEALAAKAAALEAALEAKAAALEAKAVALEAKAAEAAAREAADERIAQLEEELAARATPTAR
jgi:hypothetical protein